MLFGRDLISEIHMEETTTCILCVALTTFRSCSKYYICQLELFMLVEVKQNQQAHKLRNNIKLCS